jgi:hypothetical protein
MPPEPRIPIHIHIGDAVVEVQVTYPERRDLMRALERRSTATAPSSRTPMLILRAIQECGAEPRPFVGLAATG